MLIILSKCFIFISDVYLPRGVLTYWYIHRICVANINIEIRAMNIVVFIKRETDM